MIFCNHHPSFQMRFFQWWPLSCHLSIEASFVKGTGYCSLMNTDPHLVHRALQIFQSPCWITVTSWTSFLLAQLLSLDGWPDLSRVWVVWYVFHRTQRDNEWAWTLLITLSWTVLLHHFMSDFFGKLLVLYVCPVCWPSELYLKNSLYKWGSLIFKLNHWLHTGETYCTYFVTVQTNNLLLKWFRVN